MKKNRSEELIEKAKRINEADIDKIRWVSESGNVSDISFHLEPFKNIKEGRNRALGDEINCYICNEASPRGIAIPVKGKLPNWAHNNGEMKEFSFRQWLCSEKCADRLKGQVYAFTKEGKYDYHIMKIVWKILYNSDWFHCSFHELELVLNKQDKGYICKGCRKQKSLLVPYFNVIARNKKSTSNDYKAHAGRVCSKECYDLFIMKVI